MQNFTNHPMIFIMAMWYSWENNRRPTTNFDLQPYTVLAEKGTAESNLFTPGTEKSTTPNAVYIMMIPNTFVHNVFKPEIAEREEIVLEGKEQETIYMNWKCIQ